MMITREGSFWSLSEIQRPEPPLLNGRAQMLKFMLELLIIRIRKTSLKTARKKMKKNAFLLGFAIDFRATKHVHRKILNQKYQSLFSSLRF